MGVIACIALGVVGWIVGGFVRWLLLIRRKKKVECEIEYEIKAMATTTGWARRIHRDRCDELIAAYQRDFEKHER